jgi:YD repeat-containing protein
MRLPLFRVGISLLFFVSDLSRAVVPGVSTFEIAHFFPLQVGTYWLYQLKGDVPTTKIKVVAKTTPYMLNGMQATLFDEWRYGWKTLNLLKKQRFFTNDASGVSKLDDVEVCFDPPAYRYLPPIVTTGDVYSNTNGTSCTGHIASRTITVGGLESIKTPDFQGEALRINEVIIDTSPVSPPNATSTITTTHWYAEYIGLVKEDAVTTMDMPFPPYSQTIRSTKEIVSASNLGDDEKDDGCSECSVGNPINYGTGNKFQVETDFESPGQFPLRFQRFYNSRTAGSATLGIGWRHNYDSSLTPILDATPPTVVVSRASGKAFIFIQNNGVWKSDADVTDKLEAVETDLSGNVTKWRYTGPTDEIEIYDQDGKLLSITNRSGMSQTVTYQPNSSLIAAVVDSQARRLDFSYNTGTNLLAQISDPNQQVISFTYDTAQNLTKVAYQDSKVRTYRYDEPSNIDGVDLPHALTSIVDENGAVFAMWHYDSKGRAVSSEHANGAEKVVVSYGENGTTVIIDSLGQTRTFNVQKVLGVSKNTNLSDPCPNCRDGATASKTYDSNGNVTSRVDFNGNMTCYAYDLVRNLETVRIEGLSMDVSCASSFGMTSLVAPRRKRTTQWHATYRLPTKVAEPNRITTYDYDTSGNLQSRTEQATTDATGTARIWRYTYNQVGQVHTVTGPRTDVDDTTTYDYDSQGNLATVTNALHQATTLSNYDANGRVGRIVDANGLTTDLTYWERGWLKTKTVGGETTRYDYDGTGLIKTITLPDASYIAYTYDDAHRLTDIADSAGNSIHYTLDLMGNRTGEDVKDPTGTLTQQVTRVYDSLSRLQQVTGAAQ